ncbi:murein L,D-transpeptidase [Brachybacterium endophyticum]|uniref:Murein L,D-transpeptidase n=1 Tax=Brachybacterium endophyticum TaxID=2182385 RepID=A0A2U2RP23_9MICO|nr:L,D-transpeptidase family protein [Brachybacterium endophyticum]PWH07606.1 murein L,D-transpeptidase [Brachybacterium endophyticum]
MTIDRTTARGAVGRRTLLVGAPVLTASLAMGTAPALAKDTVLKKGSRGSAVTSLQKSLAKVGYWCGSADGSFGATTQQAVYALQKAAGLTADGVYGPKSKAALAAKKRPKPKITSGTAFEIDKKKQLIYCISSGKLKFILNTSTGSGKRYYSGGRWKTATTPSGDYTMQRFHSSGWETAPLGRLYRAGYYDRGWAIHGSTSIPPYADSHGCSRLSVAATDMLWKEGWMKKGRRVLVH